MFYGVGHVYLVPSDPRLAEQPVHQMPSRADERPPLKVFVVAGLLAEEHDARAGGSFAEYGLRCMAPQAAVLAFIRLLCQFRQRTRHWRQFLLAFQTLGHWSKLLRLCIHLEIARRGRQVTYGDCLTH